MPTLLEAFPGACKAKPRILEKRSPEQTMPIGEPYGPREIEQNLYVLETLGAQTDQLYHLTLETLAGARGNGVMTSWLGA